MFDKILYTKAGVKALYYVGIESVKVIVAPAGISSSRRNPEEALLD